MTTYRVSFYVEVPDDVPVDDVESFMKFELGQVAYMSGSNALADKELSSLHVSGVDVM